MAQAKLSDAECHAIHALRHYAPADSRKTAKREIFSRAKAAFGIPANHKMVVDVDVNEPNHGVLKNKTTREAYELNDQGKWVGGNGAAGGLAPKRWFKVAADDLHTAIIDSLDNADEEEIEWRDVEPAGHKFTVTQFGNPVRLCITSEGDAYVELAKDAYDTETDHEEEDDLPY